MQASNQMLRLAKRSIRWALRPFGYEVRHSHNYLDYFARKGVRTVLDIGANYGQFAEEVRHCLPNAEIHSFEPLQKEYVYLCKLMEHDAHLFAHQLALSDVPGMLTLNVNRLTAASSFLEVSAQHLKAFPESGDRRPLEIPVTTLDTWAAGRKLERPLLIKLDVQGYEDRVICGGRDTIGVADYLVCEVSFVEMYCGQPLFDSIYRMLSPAFSLAGMVNNLYDPASTRILQADAIFERNKS